MLGTANVTLQWKGEAGRAVISQVLLMNSVAAGHLTWSLPQKVSELCTSAPVQEICFKSRVSECSLSRSIEKSDVLPPVSRIVRKNRW